MLSVRMSKSIVCLSFASAIALLCCALNAQQSTKPDPRHKEMARVLVLPGFEEPLQLLSTHSRT